MFRPCIISGSIRHIVSLVAGLGLLLIFINTTLLWKFRASRLPARTGRQHGHISNVLRSHPIDTLMANAETDFQALLDTQTTDLHSAAEAYRRKRGRHPPPGFDAWFDYAQHHDALVIEDLFDQIHRDLTPFWGMPGKGMREFARHFEHHISVRNGTADMTLNHGQGTARDRMEAWLDLVRSIETLLPDLDIAINIMDESRVIVPWEEISRHVENDNRTKPLLSPEKVVSQYQGLQTSDSEPSDLPRVDWIGPNEPYWDIARVGCAPHTPARNQAAAVSFEGPPPMPLGYPLHSFQGYVKNWTLARDPCQQPHLQESHGTFVEPVSISTTRALVPLFGESKLSMNNDILIPPAAYLSETFSRGEYSGTHALDGSWSDKKAGVVWRGAASGGRNKEETWTRFHRHRFVSMLNGTYIQGIEVSADAVGKGRSFALQSYTTYNLASTKYTDLGTWLEGIADVGFTDLLCWPTTDKHTCSYTDRYFEIVRKIPMSKQYDYKFLPDIDGNSFSGRYLNFLRSTSVPIKATLYSEWHDDRLIPWLHFVPMDNSFVDVYGILDYFVKTDGDRRGTGSLHDDAAKKIAIRGQDWADQVLRKEDMRVYMFRLLLEYARLCDDHRDVLGFVGDLRDQQSARTPVAGKDAR